MDEKDQTKCIKNVTLNEHLKLIQLFFIFHHLNLSNKGGILKRPIYFQRKKNHVYPVENAAEM